MLDKTPVLGGSSKDFYKTEDPDVLRVVFKDVMHGRGRVQEIAGTGRLREEFCFNLYRLLEREGIRTHIAQSVAGQNLQDGEALLPNRGILVRKLDMVAMELIARYVARGNWADAHKFPVLSPGQEFKDPAVEFCLKWKKDVPNLDFQKLSTLEKAVHAAMKRFGLERLLVGETVTRDDPRVGMDMAMALHLYSSEERIKGHLIGSKEEWEELRKITLRVNNVLAEFLRSVGWKLEDGKFEVGRIPGESGFVVGDEYTQDSSRIVDENGHSLSKDLHRMERPATEIYDRYALLTDQIKFYAS